MEDKFKYTHALLDGTEAGAYMVPVDYADIYKDKPEISEAYRQLNEERGFNWQVIDTIGSTLVAWLYERLKSRLHDLEYCRSQDWEWWREEVDFPICEIDGKQIQYEEYARRMVDNCEAILKVVTHDDRANAESAKNDLFKLLDKTLWML